MVKEVGPRLGVRVYKLNPTRDGGVVIRTTSVAEPDKVAANANTKFGEPGLGMWGQARFKGGGTEGAFGDYPG